MAATVEPTAQVAEDCEQENTTRASDNGEKGKESITFKDAIGRTYTFPFHLAKTWAVSYAGPLSIARLSTSI